MTQGKELPLNQMTEMLRQECAMAGYTEILTWSVGQIITHPASGTYELFICEYPCRFPTCFLSCLPGIQSAP